MIDRSTSSRAPRRAGDAAASTAANAPADGLSNAEIAETMFISHATAKTHVSRLLTKLGARDRAQLVMLADESGLVVPGAEQRS